jgi:hypothetical protein
MQATPPPAATCRQFHVHEITLRSASRHENPFLVSPRARVVGPDGGATVVHGFYDGHHRLVTTHDDDVFYCGPRHAGATDFVTDQYHRDLTANLMAQRLRWRCPIIN